MYAVRTLLVAIVAFTSVACGAQSAATTEVKAVDIAPTPLLSLDSNDNVVVGKGQQMDCGPGLQKIELSSKLSRTDPVGDTGVNVRTTHATNMTHETSEAVYAFDGSLPKIRGAFVTVMTGERLDVLTWPPLPSVTIQFRTTWPKEATEKAMSVSVDTSHFGQGGTSLVGIALCEER